jgi:hypothetical protein
MRPDPQQFHPPTPYAELPVAELVVWSRRLQECAREWATEMRRLRQTTGPPVLTGATAQAMKAVKDELMAEMAALTAELERRGDELAGERPR